MPAAGCDAEALMCKCMMASRPQQCKYLETARLVVVHNVIQTSEYTCQDGGNAREASDSSREDASARGIMDEIFRILDRRHQYAIC